MPKSIVFCADGTWNSPGQDTDHDGVADPTNVFKLFCNLAGTDSPDTTRLANEQEKVLTAGGRVAQIAKYLHGVGDSRNFVVRLLGGAGGRGLITRIVRGYTFVSRAYEPGDRIFLVGFSRGAYTARALGGLIAARGVLDATKHDLNDKEQAYRLGSAVWFDYRKEASRGKPGMFDRLREWGTDLPGFVSQPPTPSRVSGVRIATIAVWDTVGAYGIPTYARDGSRDDPFQFANLALSPLVDRGLHAVAIDEERSDFTPTLWDRDPRITQMLFAGAHSDVGGGYPASGQQCALSDAALLWMMEELAKDHLLFRQDLPYVPSPDPGGVGHQPWAHAPWTALPRARRQLAGMMCHPSVDKRRQFGPVSFEPGMAAVAYDPRNI